jgi:hypothetical protein
MYGITLTLIKIKALYFIHFLVYSTNEHWFRSRMLLSHYRLEIEIYTVAYLRRE